MATAPTGPDHETGKTPGETLCETPGDIPGDAAGDDTLMRGFAAGSAAAFEQLYARHQAALYRFVRRVLGPAQAAQVDEVFQDTWLKLIQARERWSPQGAAFRTWLFTIAHHRAVDCLRKSGREIGGMDDNSDGNAPWQPDGDAWQHWPPPPPAGMASQAVQADELAFWRAAGQRLLDCLDGLPAAQKTVFLLHHEDGLALPELASALELGFETAKSRLRYAMGKLRTCMGAYLEQSTPAAATRA